MKNKIKRFLLLVMVIAISIASNNFENGFYSTNSIYDSYNSITKVRLKDGTVLYYPELADYEIYSYYYGVGTENEYLHILYVDLGYRFARVDTGTMVERGENFKDCMGAETMFLGSNKSYKTPSYSQKKSKVQSYISEHKNWFIKINNSSNFVINDSQVSIKIGNKYTLTTSSTNTIKWTSSNKKIASINSKGKITAKKSGKVKITATDTVTGEKSYCLIYVYNKKKNNLDNWRKKIYNQSVKLKEAYNQGKNDYNCAGFAITLMNKVCGSNNYYFYSMKYDYIYGKNGNKKIIAKSTRIKRQLKAKDLQTGDIISSDAENHAYVVLENNGNSLEVVETIYVQTGYMTIERRISYNFINSFANKNKIHILRHKKLA